MTKGKKLPKLIDKGIAFTDKNDECYGEHEYESEPILIVTTDGDVGMGTLARYSKPENFCESDATFLGYTYLGEQLEGDPEDIALWVPLAKLKEVL